jgi:two-component system, NtrC family, nitrogen regulation response regulator GlnG
LFHRLNVIRLRLPALRERKEDVTMLTRHFLQQSGKQLGVEPKRISDAALTWLEGFAFPGNVRQLENICHWLTVMAPSQVIEPKDLPPEIGVGRVEAAHPSPAPTTLVATVDQTAHTAAAQNPVALAMPMAEDALPIGPGNTAVQSWELDLEAEAVALLGTGQTDVWDVLTRRFESRLILAALAATRGRRIEAAQKLGIGRNTITRKIQELGLE